VDGSDERDRILPDAIRSSRIARWEWARRDRLSRIDETAALDSVSEVVDLQHVVTAILITVRIIDEIVAIAARERTPVGRRISAIANRRATQIYFSRPEGDKVRTENEVVGGLTDVPQKFAGSGGVYLQDFVHCVPIAVQVFALIALGCDEGDDRSGYRDAFPHSVGVAAGLRAAIRVTNLSPSLAIVGRCLVEAPHFHDAVSLVAILVQVTF
jgi:hypothetical protein